MDFPCLPCLSFLLRLSRLSCLSCLSCLFCLSCLSCLLYLSCLSCLSCQLNGVFLGALASLKPILPIYNNRLSCLCFLYFVKYRLSALQKMSKSLLIFLSRLLCKLLIFLLSDFSRLISRILPNQFEPPVILRVGA